MVLSSFLIEKLRMPFPKVYDSYTKQPLNHRRRIKKMMVRLEAEGKRNNLSLAKITQHIEYHVEAYVNLALRLHEGSTVEHKGQPHLYIAGDRTKLFTGYVRRNENKSM